MMAEMVRNAVHKSSPYVSYANLIALLALLAMITFGVSGIWSGFYDSATITSPRKITMRLNNAEANIRHLKKNQQRIEREMQQSREANIAQYRDLNHKVDKILFLLSKRGRS